MLKLKSTAFAICLLMLAAVSAHAQTNLVAPIGVNGCGATAVQKGGGATPTIDWNTGDTCTTNATLPYSSAQTFVSNSSGTVANGSAAASLAAVAAKTNFITGFDITSDGATTGLCVAPTITGILGGTRTMTYCAPGTGALVEATPLIMQFNPPLQASAVNTAIVVTLPALGSGSTNATVNVQGFFQ